MLFSRQELYELVWSKPVTKLTQELCITTHHFYKLCKQNQVPLPKPGHWEKLRFGKPVVIIPLPPEVEIIPKKKKSELVYKPIKIKIEPILSESSKLRTAIKEDEALTLTVLDRIKDADPIIEQAVKAFRGRKADSKMPIRNILSPVPGIINISVSPKLLDRSLRFMDALVKLVKARGHFIRIESERTVFIVDQVSLPVRCREKLERKVINEGNWKRAEFIPTGKLSFRIDGNTSKQWDDGEKPIEEKLTWILAGLELMARHENKKQLEINARINNQEDKRQEDQLNKLSYELERAKWNKLLRDAQKWRECEIIERFLHSARMKLDKEASSIEGENWLTWATQAMNDSNPLFPEISLFLESYSVEQLSIAKDETKDQFDA